MTDNKYKMSEETRKAAYAAIAESVAVCLGNLVEMNEGRFFRHDDPGTGINIVIDREKLLRCIEIEDAMGGDGTTL